MNRTPIYALTLVVALAATGCTGYEQLLRSTDHNLQYRKALEFFEARDYYRATILFERVLPIYRGSQRADTIEFRIAQGHYYQGDFLLAGHHFDRFRRNFPRSPFAEEATFMYAYCHYRASPRPLLDQESTRLAIAAFNEFITRFPHTARRAEINRLLTALKLRLEEKAHLGAMLYYNMGDYKAAITSLRNTLIDFPNSPFREDQLFYILRASYLLASNSIPSLQRERFQNALDGYYSLLSEFPQTRHLKDAERIYARIENFLTPQQQ